MANYLKFSQLAKALGVNNASITMAVKQKTLIATDEKTIDIANPSNRMWIDRQVAKGRTFNMNMIFEKSQTVIPFREKEIESKPENELEPEKKGKPKNKEDKLDTLRDLEIKQKRATLLRTEKSIKLDDLRIRKQEGLLIPYDEAEFLLIYIVEKIRNTSIQEIDSMTNIYKERFGISHDEYIELKVDLNEIINGIIKESVDELKVGIENIQQIFMENRERGQRK
jgi:hypothetical protein